MTDLLYILLEKAQEFEQAVNFHLNDIVTQPNFAEKVLDLNRDQLDQGIRSDGSQIGPDYKAITVKYKQSKGQPYDRVTLKDQGDFYDGLRVFGSYGRMDIYGTDWKTQSLEYKYNDGPTSTILGLTENSLNFLRAMIRPELQSFTKTYFIIK